jgi:hypothetical protein
MISVTFKGLTELREAFRDAPDALEREIGEALGRSIAMVETESKRRTPVRTGYLRSSIGGQEGFSFVRGLTAGVGTNVKYAIYVHEGHARHAVGERKFMEKGAEASVNFIIEQFQKALEKVVVKIAKS